VSQFKITGAKLIVLEKLQEHLRSYLGKALTFKELNAAAQSLLELYKLEGIAARIILPPQDIVGGVVEIQVIEGHLGGVLIQPVEGMVAPMDEPEFLGYLTERQKVGEPLSQADVERALLILNDLAGVQVAGALEPGDKPGETRLVVRVSDLPAVTGSVGISNTGGRATGASQGLATLNWNNPSRIGDQWSLAAMGSQGVRYGKIAYTLPVSYDGWKFGVNASHMTYDTIPPMNASHANGRAATIGLSSAYPIIRSQSTNLTHVLTFDQKDAWNYINVDQESSTKRMNVVSTGFTGSYLSDVLGGVIPAYSVMLTYGKLYLHTPSEAANDLAGPQTQGGYSKVMANVQWQKDFTSESALAIALSGQWARKNLDAGERMYLGGPSAVRAFPSAEVGGDQGWMANFEWRQLVHPDVQMVAFYDIGRVQQHKTIYSDMTTNNWVGLQGYGLGANYLKDGWVGKAIVAWRAKQNPLADSTTGMDADGTKRIPRIWLQLSKNF